METTTIAGIVNELNAANAQLTLALAACRSIKFACDNASRHGGEFSLTDIYAADRLARQATDNVPTVKPAPKPLRARSIKLARA